MPSRATVTNDHNSWSGDDAVVAVGAIDRAPAPHSLVAKLQPGHHAGHAPAGRTLVSHHSPSRSSAPLRYGHSQHSEHGHWRTAFATEPSPPESHPTHSRQWDWIAADRVTNSPSRRRRCFTLVGRRSVRPRESRRRRSSALGSVAAWWLGVSVTEHCSEGLRTGELSPP